MKKIILGIIILVIAIGGYFVSTKDNPIQLPENIISEKDCAAAGGEVWNTLGETSYNGELIGKIEELRCPCACLVK